MFLHPVVAAGLRTVLVVSAAAVATNAQSPFVRVSVDSNSNETHPSHYRQFVSISGDGRHVAFESEAPDLVTGDTNGVADIFVHDLVTGATVRVSVSSSGVQGDSMSLRPAISRDGRYVAFMSWARNLVASDTNGWTDVFFHDRDPDGNGVFDEGNGTTVRASVASDGSEGDSDSMEPDLSADGMRVAFASGASNLVAGDTGWKTDIFVHDMTTGVTTRVSVDSSGVQGDRNSFLPAISADGNVVAFASFASNLDGNDANPKRDVFVHDCTTGVTELVSVDSNGVQADNYCDLPDLSSDGSIVAFESWANHLVANDRNRVPDVFVRDRTTGTTTRVSVDSSGVEGDSYSEEPSLSADGNLVTFRSWAGNLAPGDGNGFSDIYMHDRVTGETRLVSGSCGAAGDYGCLVASISDDGTRIAFESAATNLVSGDTNGADDFFVRLAPDPVAAWNNYGAGFPGSLGIPSLTASAAPRIGTSFTIDAGNSLGSWTAALLLFGTEDASVPTHFGGTLLVDFAFVSTVVLPPAGASVAATVPAEPMYAGFHVFFQVVEFDAGAANGWSFSPGLDLLLGG